MKVLLVHNRYRTSAPSGEDVVVDNEERMLRRNGVSVVRVDRCNDDLDDRGVTGRIRVALDTVWSTRSRADLARVVAAEKPDIVHVHNTFAMLSPSIYGAFGRAGIPVIQTLHNFRLYCPGALFMRDRKPCEACVDHGLHNALRYRCYRNSLPQTAVLATMLAVNRSIGTYDRNVTRYIALTEFARQRFVHAGIDPGRIRVKGNFLPNPPAPGTGSGGHVAFVGRLLDGKGVGTLLEAWRRVGDIPLKVLGDGALRPELERAAREAGSPVEFLGAVPRERVLQIVSAASFLVVPSEWYEGFPMVVAEAFACGTPVLASRIGSLDELVTEGVTGRKFAPGDPGALAQAAIDLYRDSDGRAAMRRHCRTFFDSSLNEESHFDRLMAIYEEAAAAVAR